MRLQGQYLTPRPLHRAWGHREVVKVANPAEGSAFSITVPPPLLWLPIYLQFVVTVGIEKKATTPAVEYQDGNENPLGFTFGSHAVAASKSEAVGFQLWDVAPQFNEVFGSLSPLPRVVLEPSNVIKAFGHGIEAGSSITSITLLVEAFELDPRHDLAEIEAMARRIQDLERKVAEHAL